MRKQRIKPVISAQRRQLVNIGAVRRPFQHAGSRPGHNPFPCRRVFCRSHRRRRKLLQHQGSVFRRSFLPVNARRRFQLIQRLQHLRITLQFPLGHRFCLSSSFTFPGRCPRRPRASLRQTTSGSFHPRLPQSAQLTVPNRCRLVSAAVCPVGSRKTSYKNSITQKKAAVNRKKALALDKILCYY